MSKNNIEFKMAPKLLLDVIQRQAGSLGKAIIEGVMNSADAGATECRVQVTECRVQIKDNGKGFRTEKEVEEWFGTFGTPHAAEEEKVYGTFRMGRGQLFSFGRNVWTTGRYELSVDINKSITDTGKIAYDVVTKRTRAPGCSVDILLYSPIRTWAVEDTVREVSQACKYMPNIEVYVNDTPISVDPATEEWDVAEGNIYLRLKDTGPLRVYSKGVFVTERSSYLVGSGGDVISVDGFELNFARNAVLEHQCGTWGQVVEAIRNASHKKAMEAARLTPAAKHRYSLELNTGRDSPEHVNTLKLLTSVKGSSYSVLRMFEVINSKFLNRVTVAPKGCPRGDKVMQSGLAFVLAQECVDRFEGKTIKGVVDTLSLALATHDAQRHVLLNVGKVEVVTVDSLIPNNSRDWEEMPDTETSVETRTWMKLLREFSTCAECEQVVTQYAETPVNRAITLGKHYGLAVAWTDGMYHIHFDESYLKFKSLSSTLDTVQVAATLWHEYVHGDTSCDSHIHGNEFYERFHDGAEHFIGEFLKFRDGNLGRILDTMSRRETKKLKKARERREALEAKAERIHSPLDTQLTSQT
jgi:hypothetical protein